MVIKEELFKLEIQRWFINISVMKFYLTCCNVYARLRWSGETFKLFYIQHRRHCNISLHIFKLC